MRERKPDGRRGNIAFIFLVLLGYAIGFMIKKVHVGLILGLAMGLLASGILRRR